MTGPTARRLARTVLLWLLLIALVAWPERRVFIALSTGRPTRDRTMMRLGRPDRFERTWRAEGTREFRQFVGKHASAQSLIAVLRAPPSRFYVRHVSPDKTREDPKNGGILLMFRQSLGFPLPGP